jgi:hypothetical protein
MGRDLEGPNAFDEAVLQPEFHEVELLRIEAHLDAFAAEAGLILDAEEREDAGLVGRTLFAPQEGLAERFLVGVLELVDPASPASERRFAGLPVDLAVVLQLDPGGEGLVERVECGDLRGAKLGEERTAGEAVERFDLASFSPNKGGLRVGGSYGEPAAAAPSWRAP